MEERELTTGDPAFPPVVDTGADDWVAPTNGRRVVLKCAMYGYSNAAEGDDSKDHDQPDPKARCDGFLYRLRLPLLDRHGATKSRRENGLPRDGRREPSEFGQPSVWASHAPTMNHLLPSGHATAGRRSLSSVQACI